MSTVRGPTVVKLGGSLADGRRLQAILAIVGAARLACVVVPGGGSFADAVRAAHRKHGISEAVAHRMALLAMHQTGMLLAGMHARLTPVETLAAMRRAIAESRIPVWMPLRLADGDAGVTADWRTTSDALAARLAERLGGGQVVLVKSCRVDRAATAARLVRQGIVDPVFAEIVARAKLPWRVLGTGDDKELSKLVGAPHRSGRRRPAKRAIARSR